MAEATTHQDFRDRTRQEYEERRAEGRLGKFETPSLICLLKGLNEGPAQLTCRTLDEKEGKEVRSAWYLTVRQSDTGLQFGVLWLNPTNPETFPPDLLGVLELHSVDLGIRAKETELSVQDRLRRQMQKDKLQPLREDENGLIGAPQDASTSESAVSPELIEEAIQFLRLRVSLSFVTD